jgi:phosphohistidine phosphatase
MDGASEIVKQRRLILMRHATAGPGGGSDAQRPLTSRGQQEAQAVGAALRRAELVPDFVLCSTAIRCRETWQGVSKAFTGSIRLELVERLYNASATALLDAIAESEECETLLVLAHNPGISMLALELAGDSEQVRETGIGAGFSPAAIAGFEVDGPFSLVSRRSARLILFARPPRI